MVGGAAQQPMMSPNMMQMQQPMMAMQPQQPPVMMPQQPQIAPDQNGKNVQLDPFGAF